MDILIIYKGSFPNGMAMTRRLQYYCKGLVAEGNKVNIIIPHATEQYGTKHNVETEGEYFDTRYKYLSKSTIRSKHFLARRINDFTGYLQLLMLMLFRMKGGTRILMIDVRNMWRLPIYFAAKIRRSKVVYELNEHPLIFAGRTKYLIERRFVFPLFDGYIVISSNLENLVLSFKKRKAQIIKVPILTEKLSSEELIGLNRDFGNYIIHTGTISDKKEGVISIIKAYLILREKHDQDMSLLFSGKLESSPDKIEIEKILKANATADIRFLGYLSEEELKLYQANAALVVMNKPDNLQNHYCFPTKLGEFMSLGIPVIATKVGEYTNYLESYSNAILIDSGTPEFIADSAMKILENEQLNKHIRVQAKETSDNNFYYGSHSANLDSFLRTI
jgi:glycosyltransferase involved in cell wall biosynthesis